MRFRFISLLAAVGFLICSCADEASNEPIGIIRQVGPEVGDIAPDFALPGSSGHEIRLSTYRGTVVLVDFWASWCEPCKKKLPELKQIWSDFRGERFVLLSISRDYTLSAWQDYITAEKLDWVHVYESAPNKSGPVSETYGVPGIPWMFLIDREGVVRGVNLSGDSLRAAIEEALGG